MKIQIFKSNSCCGRKSILVKCDKVLSKEMIDKFVSLGFTSSEIFLKSGLLYFSSSELSLTGAIGSNNFQLGCKIANCDDVIKNLENQLKDY